MTHRTSSHLSRPACLDDLAGYVPQTFIDGAKAASDAFRKANIRHVLVGGLAVGANGYPRSTKDIDFLVGDEAFIFHGPIVEQRSGLPIKYSGVTIDWVSLEPNDRTIFQDFLCNAVPGEVPVMPVTPLIAMKLLAGRQRDQADVVELIKSGSVDIDCILKFVENNFPPKLQLLNHLIELAIEETA